MQKTYARKPHARRRHRRSEARHWLEEGSLGQETLFSELDPYLLATDRILCRRATQLAFRLKRSRETPRAVLLPPAGTVGWQIGHLAKHFELYVWCPEPDEIQEAAAAKFGAILISGSLDQLPDACADLIMITDVGWRDRREFAEAVRELREYLSGEGEALCVLRAIDEGTGVIIEWDAGSRLPLGELLAANDAPSEWELAPLVTGPSDFDLGTFLKRHRTFFGRNARDFCLDRLYDPDFARNARDSTRCAVLLSWGPA